MVEGDGYEQCESPEGEEGDLGFDLPFYFVEALIEVSINNLTFDSVHGQVSLKIIPVRIII